MNDEFIHVALLNGGLVLAMMLAMWAISVVIRDSSIADIFWGLGFVVIVFFTTAVSDGSEERRQLVTILTTIWGLRLAVYIGWRNWGAEDARYARLREHVTSKGKNYALHSLVHIYLLQGFFMWLVSLVLIFALTMDTPPTSAHWHTVVSCCGASAWSSKPWVTGSWLDSSPIPTTKERSWIAAFGATRVIQTTSGRACVWFGFFLIAVENPWGVVTAISLATIYYALLGPTGKGLLERRMSKKRPEFAAYKKRTSGFFPMPPRST